MLIRAKKHVLSSYSYSNLSFHRKITKTTQKWVVFFCIKKDAGRSPQMAGRKKNGQWPCA